MIRTSSDITRAEIKEALGIEKFSMRRVDFTDLARSSAYTFKVTATSRGMNKFDEASEYLERYDKAKEIFRDRTYKGCRILVSW